MITRERLKQKIDRVQDSYLDILFHIIQTFEYAPPLQRYDTRFPSPISSDDTLAEWHAFVEKTYGILTSDPIERGEQGTYEVREAIR